MTVNATNERIDVFIDDKDFHGHSLRKKMNVDLDSHTLTPRPPLNDTLQIIYQSTSFLFYFFKTTSFALTPHKKPLLWHMA